MADNTKRGGVRNGNSVARSETGAARNDRAASRSDTGAARIGQDAAAGAGVFSSSLFRVADRMSKIAVTTLIAAALILGSFMAVRTYSDNAVKTYIGKAGRHFENGEYAKAADLYSKYLKKNPESKTAMLGYLASLIPSGRPAALENARSLLASGALAAADYPEFIQLCERIGNRELNADAYAAWLKESPGHTGAMAELAKTYIESGAIAQAAGIIESISEAGYGQAAAVLLGRAVERAQSLRLPAAEYAALCEMWAEADGANIDAWLALADAYAKNGMPREAEKRYRDALGMDAAAAAAYDGLLSLIYRDDRLRERFDLLEAAVRHVGGKKYKDMLDSARAKLAEYYSLVREDGVTYRDGIFNIARIDPYGNEILPGAGALYGPDEISYRIGFYDNLGNAKEMFLDSSKIQTHIADIDYDGVREVLIKRYVTADGMSVEAMKYAFWYDVYRIDREINKLIFSTPDYARYYKNVYARELAAKMARFERLSEALEGHYGVVYGLFYALRAAALDFASGEWAPDGTGVDLRGRLCDTLIVPDLESYVADKGTMFGYGGGDLRVLPPGGAADGGEDGGEDAVPAGLYPGIAESAAKDILGPPRYVTEEEMKAIRPDGEKVTYKNRILEYAGVNLYICDGIMKAMRVNSREFEGPRALRIGDTVRDVVNKFPAAYFDDTADFITKKADSEFELADAEQGIVLNYIFKNGVIMNIELYIRDDSGDWKPGANIETILNGADGTAGAVVGGAGATAAMAAGTGDANSDTAGTGASEAEAAGNDNDNITDSTGIASGNADTDNANTAIAADAISNNADTAGMGTAESGTPDTAESGTSGTAESGISGTAESGTPDTAESGEATAPDATVLSEAAPLSDTAIIPDTATPSGAALSNPTQNAPIAVG